MGFGVKLSDLKRLLVRSLALLAVMTPLQTFSAHTRSNELSVDAVGVIRFCNAKLSCEEIPKTGDMRKAIADGYEQISIVDIYQDGGQEVAATSADGCSRFFSFDRATRKFYAISFDGTGRDICNYQIHANHLISSYKLDSKQYEDIYDLKNDTYQLVLSDGCVGCDQVARSVYQDGRLSEKLLVSNQNGYNQRQPLASSVLSGKAWLYSAPSSASKTNMYLIKGDRVQLLEFNDANGFWYFIKFRSKGNKFALKWVKCEDLAVCQ